MFSMIHLLQPVRFLPCRRPLPDSSIHRNHLASRPGRIPFIFMRRVPAESVRGAPPRLTGAELRRRMGYVPLFRFRRAATMKKLLVALVFLVALLVLAGVAILFLVDVNAHKPRIESAVSDALGMEFRIRGKARLRLFPSASIALSDVRLRNRGTDLVTAETLRVGVKLLPLLNRQVDITELVLEKPVIRIEKGADGKFNYETPPRPAKPAAKEGEALPLPDRFQRFRVGGEDRVRRPEGGERNEPRRDRPVRARPLDPRRPGGGAPEGDLLLRRPVREGDENEGPHRVGRAREGDGRRGRSTRSGPSR